MLEQLSIPTLKNNASPANNFFAAADKVMAEAQPETIVQREETTDGPPSPPPALPSTPPNAPPPNNSTPLPPPALPSPNGTGDTSIDYFAMSQPYFNRGVPWMRMGPNSGIEQQWKIGYRFGRELGLNDERSAWLSNKLTPAAIEFNLSHDTPTPWERMSNEMGVSPIMLPIPALNFKLEVNAPGDAAEQEANAVAQKIVDDDAPVHQNSFFKPAAKPVQRSETEVATAPQITAQVNEVLQQPGEPLPHQSRQFFQSRFGRDFSDVRIHTNSQAAESSKALQATAFTSGTDIVFMEGAFNPATREGKNLLAHELTHVVQQGFANPLSSAKKAAKETRRSGFIQRDIYTSEADESGFQSLYSNATSINGLFHDVVQQILARSRNYRFHSVFVYTQNGISIFNIRSRNQVQTYRAREGEPMPPLGIYGLIPPHMQFLGIDRNNRYQGVNIEIEYDDFSEGRQATIRQRGGGVLLEDFVEVTSAQLVHDGHLPAIMIVGRLPVTTGTGTGNGAQVEGWANQQVSRLQSRFGIAGGGTYGATSQTQDANGSSTLASSGAGTQTSNGTPVGLVAWAANEHQYVNVWVDGRNAQEGGVSQAIELHQGESGEQVEQRVRDAATALAASIDPTQSTQIAGGAQQTGF